MTDQNTNTSVESQKPADGDGAMKSRRRFLQVGAALAAGAVAATMLEREDAAAAGLVNGQSNGPAAAVNGYNSTNGPGVWGRSVSGIGVWGNAEQNDGDGVVGSAAKNGRGVAGHSVNGTGVEAHSDTGVALEATADDNYAITATSPNWTAIHGSSDIDNGVRGVSETGVGVRGYSSQKIGVEGLAPYGTGVDGYSVDSIGVNGHSFYGIGVLAEAHDTSGRALQVQGQAHFETAGNAVVPAGTDNVFVNEPLTTADSHVSVTFMANPAPSGNPPPAILFVERKPDAGFVVHLTGRVEVETPISFLVVEPVIHRVSADPVRHE